LLGAVLGGLCVEGACSKRELGFPRIAVSRLSPDGRYRAFVRNHPSIDPPEQSLWLGADDGGTAGQIRKLSGDQDWCNVIEWAGDSRSVAFLVQDARLILVDPATRRMILDRWLVPQDGYPPSQVVSALSLSLDGSSARFKACRRATGACVDRIEMLHDR
jgi:hypothetical protein